MQSNLLPGSQRLKIQRDVTEFEACNFVGIAALLISCRTQHAAKLAFVYRLYEKRFVYIQDDV